MGIPIIFHQKPPPGTPINQEWVKQWGLVGCWPLWRGGGRIAEDVSGNGNPGTLYNFAFPPTATSGWNPGKDGPALAFVTDDYIDVGDIDLSGRDTITLEAVIKLNVTDADQKFISKEEGGVQYPEYVLDFTDDGNKARFGISTSNGAEGWASVSSDSALVAGTQYHIFGVYNGTDLRIYINGELDCTPTVKSGNLYDCTVDTYLGKAPADREHLNGFISKVGIYVRACTPAQVMSLYTRRWQAWDRRLIVWKAVGGVAYYQSVAGVLTPAGVIVRQVGKPIAGALTPAGAISRATSTTKAGTLTPAGTVSKIVARALAGTLTSSGTVNKAVARILSGVLIASGTIAKLPSKIVAGVLSTAGAVSKKTQRALAGTFASSGTLSATRVWFVALAGTFISSGVLTKSPQKAVSGTVSFVGTVAKATRVAVAGVFAPTGAVYKLRSLILSGTLSFVGTVAGVVTVFREVETLVLQSLITTAVSIKSVITRSLGLKSVITQSLDRKSRIK